MGTEPLLALDNEKFSKLVRHLASGSRPDSAFALAKEVLWFDPDSKLAAKNTDRAKSELALGITPEPQARTEEWEYEQVLKQAISALADVDVTRTVDLLCSVLTQHIQLSDFDRENNQPYDGSVYWRPAVEAGRWHQNYTDLLVDAIRENAERYLAKTSASFEAIDMPLLLYHWDIFTRIWLHLVRKFPVLAGKRVTRALCDKRFFAEHRFTHEYFYLIQERFGELAPESKQQIFDWIEAGVS